jgi:hypothetical protein
MPSNINPYNIDGTFPVAGQDNASQGFRDNFTNIKNNFIDASNEITELQSKAIVTSALSGQTLINNMAGTPLIAPKLQAWTQSLIDLGVVQTAATLDFTQGNFQKITTGGAISLSFANWPASTGAASLGYGSMRIWIVVTNVAHTVTLPSSVTIGDTDLAGFNSTNGSITFDVPGNYVFDFSSVDGGQNFLIFDLTRNRVQFRDPSFYFNTDVSPTFLIGFGQQILPLAIELATGSDTLEIHGSQTNYSGVLENGNNVGQYGVWSQNPVYSQLNGNANIAGYSVATSRAYVNSQGVPVVDQTVVVQPNDIIGYYNFLGATLNTTPQYFGNLDLTISEFGTIRGYATGASNNLSIDPSPGGNLWFGTKADSTIYSGGYLKAAMSLENDQSAHFYGVVTTNSGTVEAGTNLQSVATTGAHTINTYANISTLIIDSLNSATITGLLTVVLPSSPVNGQKIKIASVAPITTANVWAPASALVKYVPTNYFSSGNVNINLIYQTTSSTWYRV